MILPLGDVPNAQRTPWANWLLIAANIAVYLLISLPLSLRAVDPADPLFAEYFRAFGHLQASGGGYAISAYNLFTYTWGYRSIEPAAADLLASMFLHGGFAHLAGNMLFLWIYGDNVEARLGSVAYLVFYGLAGIGATLFYGWLSGPSPVPLIGASGAISGVLGAYVVWFPHNRVKLGVLFPFMMQVMLVPAWVVLGSYLLVDNLVPLFLGSASSTAYGAHVGGFLVGLGIALVLRHRTPQGDYADPAVPHLLAGEQALRDGRPAVAFHHLMTALRRATHDGARNRALDGLRAIEDPRLQSWLTSQYG